ncbi:MAG: DbpA RNA binding domain-containing protein [Treponema sp.]|jgi:hypothetical protein|nr:DbpA RNA binding domain-containing protein [Treponema sp.]
MSVIDEENLKKQLGAILKTIQTEADPHLLNQYRALIRKNVPFFQRSYLAAYLLMLQEQPRDRQRRFGGRVDPALRGQRPALHTPAPAALPEDESVRLFISIGRNRRVFPREILGLIYAKTSVSKEDIGTITILNNYSFVQVRSSVAADLLKALNGVSYRGKTLTINYARIRNEGDEELEEPALRAPDQDAPYNDGAMDPAAYGDTGGADPLDTAEADSSGEAATE